MSDQKTTTIRVGALAVEWPCDDLFEQLTKARAKVERLTARETDLEGALRGLIRMNEEHNAAAESVIGRPLNWSDTYLDDARAALVAGKETT